MVQAGMGLKLLFLSRLEENIRHEMLENALEQTANVVENVTQVTLHENGELLTAPTTPSDNTTNGIYTLINAVERGFQPDRTHATQRTQA